MGGRFLRIRNNRIANIRKNRGRPVNGIYLGTNGAVDEPMALATGLAGHHFPAKRPTLARSAHSIRRESRWHWAFSHPPLGVRQVVGTEKPHKYAVLLGVWQPTCHGCSLGAASQHLGRDFRIIVASNRQ